MKDTSFQLPDAPIVHVITTIMRGGAEKQLLVLVEQQIKSGKKVIIVFLKGTSVLSQDLINVGGQIRAEFSNLHPVFQVLKLRRFINLHSLKNAIIHAHLPRAQIISALSVKSSHTLICTRHDEDRFFPQKNRLISNLVLYLINRKIDYWIVISQSIKQRMLMYGELKYIKNIEVVYYGFGRNRAVDKLEYTDNLRAHYQISGKQLVIGCVARLVWQKDHRTLLKAFQIVRENIPESKLILIGEGPIRSELEIYTSELSISNSVIFTGEISLVREHLKLLNLFVLASKTEGFGLVLLEAMEAGLPIIASDIPVTREVLGDTAVLFSAGHPTDLAEKILFMSHAETQKRYSVLSSIRLDEFSPEKMWNKVRLVYEKAALK